MGDYLLYFRDCMSYIGVYLLYFRDCMSYIGVYLIYFRDCSTYFIKDIDNTWLYFRN